MLHPKIMIKTQIDRIQFFVDDLKSSFASSCDYLSAFFVYTLSFQSDWSRISALEENTNLFGKSISVFWPIFICPFLNTSLSYKGPSYNTEMCLCSVYFSQILLVCIEKVHLGKGNEHYFKSGIYIKVEKCEWIINHEISYNYIPNYIRKIHKSRWGESKI